MLLEKKEIKKIIKRLNKQTSSCIVGEVIWGVPRRKAFRYVKRKGYPVKKCGMMTFFANSEENMLSDDVCMKIARIFKAL